MNKLIGTLTVLAALNLACLAKEPVKPAIPAVESAIPAAIRALEPPQIREFPGGVRMAVSTPSNKAQQHVLQGLNHLHGGWEFEASRHFAVAMLEDPDCLLAHWGMAMALLDASPETTANRKAAIERMLDLVTREVGTELERGYAYGLMKYLTDGAAGAANAFRKVAERFPNEMQARVFASLFNRGGYDITGDATPDQLESEKQLLELMKKFPDSPIPVNALLTIRAEAPDLSGSLELARQLTRLQPGYPPAFHLLGHYEWRNGNHSRAAAAFGRASMFYQKWMQLNGTGIADCPEWAKAECYRVVALLSMGDDDTAYAAAQRVAATPLPEGRQLSLGARFLLWDAKTLPARILIHQGFQESAIKAAESLPPVDLVKPTMKQSSAYLWIDGIRLALAIQKLVNEGDIDKARMVATSLEQHIEKMSTTEAVAAAMGERSQWMRSFRALKILLGDVRGRIAMAGPADMRATAYNWYSSAMDHQQHESMLYPPMLLTPMAARLGDFFLQSKEADKAIEHYQRALGMIPDDIHSLTGLRSAHIAAGHKDKAAEIDLRIQKLKNP